MMTTLIRGIRYMAPNDWAWLFAKLAAGILVPLAVIEQSHRIGAVRSGTVSLFVLDLLMYLMLFGGLLSVVGILLRGTRTRPLIVGYSFEMGGLVMLIVGPLILAVIYLVSAAVSGGSLTGFSLCLALGAMFIARFTDIFIHHLASKKAHESRIARARRHKGES